MGWSPPAGSERAGPSSSRARLSGHEDRQVCGRHRGFAGPVLPARAERARPPGVELGAERGEVGVASVGPEGRWWPPPPPGVVGPRRLHLLPAAPLNLLAHFRIGLEEPRVGPLP